jgi:hypothetical protein
VEKIMIYIIIFLIATIIALGVLYYRIWQIKNIDDSTLIEEIPVDHIHIISFRKLEKDVLNFLKRFVQKLVLLIAEGWFLFTTKTKKFLMEKWPRIHNFFSPNKVSPTQTGQPTFFTKALLESKYKIKRLKKKIREDHDMPL